MPCTQSGHMASTANPYKHFQVEPFNNIRSVANMELIHIHSPLQGSHHQILDNCKPRNGYDIKSSKHASDFP